MYEKYGTHGCAAPRIAMTANVITYRGRSAAREVGKALSLEPAQIDRLAKVMNHFEWVDPKETLERNLREVGIDVQHADGADCSAGSGSASRICRAISASTPAAW